MTGNRNKSVQSVERAVDILKSFSPQEPEFGVGELSRRVGLAKSTVFRLLSTLESCGLVAQNPETDLYHLGVEIIILANSVFLYSDLRQIARPHLRSLVNTIGETASISVLVDREIINLYQFEFSGRLVVRAGSTGLRMPFHAASAGKAIAAFLTEEDLEIDYGKIYRLDISANIDNSDLLASSTTTVPEKGLEIDRDNSIFGDLFYRETDETGKLITPQVAYKQSENSAFYLLSISALDADIHTFIYENPFGLDINDVLEQDGKIENFQYRARWTRPENQNGGFSIMEISWFQIWFYGPYRLVLYAGDENFYHFYNTHRNVQNIDGNLHEPIFHIDGDGIGVFGSAVIDTLSLNILKK